jgi:molecular chaperone GrpE
MAPDEPNDTNTANQAAPAGEAQAIEVEVEEVTQPPGSLEARLAQLEVEKKDTYERLLRTAADFDNYRKRTRREIDDAALKARETVLKEMLPVIDNLERALSAVQGAPGGGIVDGVKLVLRQFASALERFEVKPIEAIGQPFDPAFHEAITQIPTRDHPSGTVVAEMQRGYTIGSRLLRPSLVAVAKAPEPVAPPSPAEPDAGGGQ